MSDKPTQLAQRLARHPALQERLESILNIMESSGDDLKRADEAERQQQQRSGTGAPGRIDGRDREIALIGAQGHQLRREPVFGFRP